MRCSCEKNNLLSVPYPHNADRDRLRLYERREKSDETL